jgi:uncharacterized protein (DUF2164 family)
MEELLKAMHASVGATTAYDAYAFVAQKLSQYFFNDGLHSECIVL